ncbi:MAG: AAA family ATPase [Flavobacteriales bacterium]|nr:AAA family ATPase [Flavobacteriales bacterium]
MKYNEYNTQAPSIETSVQVTEINSSQLITQEEERENRIGERSFLGMMEFSIYMPPITSTKPSASVTLEQAHDIISDNDEVRRHTNVIRGLDTKKEKDEYKKDNLLSITPSGLFEKRKTENIIEYTGYMCIDIDGLAESDVQRTKDLLISDSQIETLLIFVSPKGTGLKWFVPVEEDINLHDGYFDAISNYLRETYSIEVDKGCRDIARACFLSHDPDAFIMPNIIEHGVIDKSFISQWRNKKENSVESKPSKADNSKVSEANDLEEAICELEKRGIDITSEYDDWYKIGFAFCSMGNDGRSYFHRVSSLCSKYDFDACDDKYNELLASYDGKVTMGSFYHQLKENGIYIKKKEKKNAEVKLVASLPRTAGERINDAKNMPDIKSLLGSVMGTGELHILFADTGAGKSVFATQIADALSKGKDAIPTLKNEMGEQRVLFYDFELSDKQFQTRYTSDSGESYKFNDNLYIDNIDFQKLVEDNPKMELDSLMISKISSDIESIKPQVLIIDNLTYIRTQTTQETSVALDLMRELNTLKRKYSISIIVLAHTPKLARGTYLTCDNLGGSKHLANFVDSMSAIGKSSQGSDIRYYKQTKPSRNAPLLLSDANVITMRLKMEDSFLGFTYIENEYESNHLQVDKPTEIKEKSELVKQLNTDGMSLRAIEDETGISKSSVSRYLKTP